MNRDRSESIGWCCAAAVVIIFVAGLLVAVRDTIGNTNVALILVVFVVAAAVFGGRLAGFTAAVVAAISFNFFHTQPYLTLRVKEGQDVVTVLLLLVVGLVVGELALLRQRTRHEVVAQATGAHVLEEVLALLAADSTVDQTWTAVRDGIQTALGVQHARFWPGAGRADLPLLTREREGRPHAVDVDGPGLRAARDRLHPGRVRARGARSHRDRLHARPQRLHRRATGRPSGSPTSSRSPWSAPRRASPHCCSSRVPRQRVRSDASSVGLRKGPLVADLVFIVIVVAFFALCVGYVRLCDRIIGPDSPGREPADVTRGDELEEVGA